MDASIERLLESIPSLRGKRRTIAPLPGGITNRNFLVTAAGESLVVRVPGSKTELLGIDRTREHACTLMAMHAGIGPEVIAFLPEHALQVTRFVQGRVLEPADCQQPDILGRVAEAVRRCHTAPPVPGVFCAFDVIRGYAGIALDHGVRLPAELSSALDELAALQAELPSGEPLVPCHNDLLPSNLIDDGAAVRIIDWEYAAMGDRFFDLGNLAENNAFGPTLEEELLTLYFGDCDAEKRRRLRLMRRVSALREALWGFAQAGISSLDFDFMGYGTAHLARFFDGTDA